MKKKCVSLALALLLTIALAAPAMATEAIFCLSDEEDTLTVDCVMEYETGVFLRVYSSEDNSYATVGPSVNFNMLNPKDLTFTTTGKAADYTVRYYVLVENNGRTVYRETDTVKLSDLGGNFANLSKIAGAEMGDLIWFVENDEGMGVYMAGAGIIHDDIIGMGGEVFRSGDVLGNVETIRQGNMTYQAAQAVKAEAVSVKTENGVEEKTLIVLEDTGSNRVAVACADLDQSFPGGGGAKWDPAAGSFVRTEADAEWTDNVYYAFYSYDSSVDKDMFWTFGPVWVTYETTYKELSAAGAFSAGAVPTAYASTQSILVDGRAVEFACYALKDANGNDTNYIKLRDVASVLNGTAAQFEVGWDGAVNIQPGKSYTSNGSEMSTPFKGNRTYEAAAAPTNINGRPADLQAIVLRDDAGGAYTYYKLRDLGAVLGFTVDWSTEKGVFIETK